MRRLAVLVAVVVLAGCADQQAGNGEVSSPVPPTITPPTAPPKSPSDPRPPKDVLVGRVTRGGTGACFGMETDDGKQYALYTTLSVLPKVGDTVRVKYAPLLLKIDCGPGEHVSAITITPVE